MHATSPIATTRSRQSPLAISMTLLLVLATAAPAFRASGTAHAAPAAATAATTCTQCTTSVAGTVTAYLKATATANGSITIGGTKYVIKAGTTLSAMIKVGAYVSLRLTLNASGQVTACTVLSVKLKVSGTVSAYVKATTTANGYITIGGVKYIIKAGTTLSALVKVGVYVNVTLTLNGSNQVTACAVISVKLNVSGTVTAYVKATASTNGYIVIGGVKYIIKAGTTLSALVKVGAVVNVTLTLNGSGQVVACAVLSVKVSGLITAFVPATLLTTGQLVIGGQSFVIAKGASLSLSVGLNLTLTLTLNSAGHVTSCGCN